MKPKVLVSKRKFTTMASMLYLSEDLKFGNIFLKAIKTLIVKPFQIYHKKIWNLSLLLHVKILLMVWVISINPVIIKSYYY